MWYHESMKEVTAKFAALVEGKLEGTQNDIVEKLNKKNELG